MKISTWLAILLAPIFILSPGASWADDVTVVRTSTVSVEQIDHYTLTNTASASSSITPTSTAALKPPPVKVKKKRHRRKKKVVPSVVRAPLSPFDAIPVTPTAIVTAAATPSIMVRKPPAQKPIVEDSCSITAPARKPNLSAIGKFAIKYFHIGLSVDGLGQNQLSTGYQPGFTTNSPYTTTTSLDGFIQAKAGPWAVELDPFVKRYVLSTSYNGSGFGHVGIAISPTPWLQFYPLNGPTHFLSVGIGIHESWFSDGLEIGGFQIPNTGAGWSPAIQLAYWYRLTDYCEFRFGWEFDDIPVTSRIPGVPDLTARFDGGPFASIVF